MRQRQQLKTKKRRRQQFNTCKRHNKRCNSKIKTHNKRKGSHKRKRAQSGGTLEQVINRLNGMGYDTTTDIERIKQAFEKSNGNVRSAVDMIVRADAFAHLTSPTPRAEPLSATAATAATAATSTKTTTTLI